MEENSNGQWLRSGQGKILSKEEVDQVLKNVYEDFKKFLKAGKYKEVLEYMGNLGTYSFNNALLVISQKPDARLIHGVRGWNLRGRSVKKGEKAIRILAPVTKEIEVEKEDQEGNIVLDKNGAPVMVKKTVVKGFKNSYVFDVSQTTGKELSVFKLDENARVEDKKAIMRGLEEAVKPMGYTISYTTKEVLGPGCYGVTIPKERKIKILEGMSDLQTISTAIHECGHALAHTNPRPDFKGLTPKDRREIQEVEAESTSCVVATWLRLDTSNFNFSYIASWSEGDIEKFRENVQTISKHSHTLINAVSKELEQQRVEDRRREKEKEKAQQVLSVNPTPALEASL